VQDGRTGFLVADVPAAVDAVARVGDLRRADCRADVEQRFTDERMVQQYAELFERVVTGQPG
jgi:glycosyltransferase involved in cell wall biosynthesis